MTQGRWNQAELEVLRARYPHECAEDIARDLSRAVSSVHAKANALGLHKSPTFVRDQASRAAGANTSRKIWTAAEDQVVLERYPLETAAAIAVDLGRTVPAIHRRAILLGVTKSAAFGGGQ